MSACHESQCSVLVNHYSCVVNGNINESFNENVNESVSESFNENINEIANESVNESNDDIQERGCSTFSFSLIEYLKASLQLSVICGVLFGLFATVLWWIELNLNGYCIGKWHDIPRGIHRIQLLVEAVKVLITMYWPLLVIVPICSWSMIQQSNVIFWCIIAGLVDVVDRLSLYISGHYEAHWKSYVGNVIFLVISFIVFYKFASHRQKDLGNKDNKIIITFKVGIQLFLGMAIFLPYNYVFLQLYRDSTPLIRMMLSCTLIAVFYIPKLIVTTVITSLHGICKPKEGVVFAVGFLIITTMVTRLTQARIENLTYFVMVSLIHGIFNVLDKVTTSFRTKLFNLICRRSNNNVNEDSDYVTHFIAHQSLIGIITETSSVIMSNAAAYLLVYYYKKEESTGNRYDGSILFREMLLRSSIAVSIEWAFNIVCLKVQCCLKIPVLYIWKKQWKFILVIHLIQVIYVIVYFAHYVDAMLLGDMLHNSTSYYVGFFKRL